MLRCADGSLYTGITTDIERRLAQHNDGSGAKYTAARKPCELVYQEEAEDRSEASKREAAIKKFSRDEKIQLVVASAKRLC